MKATVAGDGSQPSPDVSQPNGPTRDNTSHPIPSQNVPTDVDFPPLPSHLQHSSKDPSTLLNPSATMRPPKSFIDAANSSQPSSVSIPVKPMSIYRGEPAILFSKDEVAAMAKPFKLSLIGKFSFGRPPIDVIRKFFIALGLKGTSQVSLLDQRHVLINLSLEEDYTRLWVRQSWYINGRSMRMFKWTTSFRCSEESPIAPVWISLPFLPIHFVNCKHALYSIAAAIGKPLRVDHATAVGNRPSLARVLVEYDISQPLLPRVWIGEGEGGFWQDIIFEKVPLYCHSCKHLGHNPNACYITVPELRSSRRTKPGQDSKTTEKDRLVLGSKPPAMADPDVQTGPKMAADVTASLGNEEQITLPMMALKNLHGSHDGVEKSNMDAGTNESRDATDVRLLEKQKSDALILIDGVEAHAVTSHGDLQLDEGSHTHKRCPMQENGLNACNMQSIMQVHVEIQSSPVNDDEVNPATLLMEIVPAHTHDNFNKTPSDTPIAPSSNRAPDTARVTGHLRPSAHAGTASDGHVNTMARDPSAQDATCSSLVPFQRDEAEMEATADVGLSPLPRTEPSWSIEPISFSLKEQQLDGPVSFTEPNLHVDLSMQQTGISNLKDKSAIADVGVYERGPCHSLEMATLVKPNNIAQLGPVGGPGSSSAIERQAQIVALQPTPNESQAQPKELIAYGVETRPKAHLPCTEPNCFSKPNSFNSNELQTDGPSNYLQPTKPEKRIQAQSTKAMAGKSLGHEPTTDASQAESSDNIDPSYVGHIGPVLLLQHENPADSGLSDSLPMSTLQSEPNTTSFQAGNLISYNPNPTVVTVASLPMPRPTYISEDYITDGTVDESDSFYMPDYSHS